MSESRHVDPERLSAYLEGDLPEGEEERVRAHLEGCRRCFRVLDELEDLVDRACVLPDRLPDRDLWPGVARAIDREASPESAPSSPPSPPWRRRFRVSLLQAVAAVLVLVAGSAGGAWLAHPDGSAGPSRAVAPVGSGGPERPAAAAPRGYAEEVARLERSLRTARDRLDPQTVRILEKNLGVIERAIRESRRALEVDPGNQFLEDHLERAYQTKLDYLRQAARMAEWSS